MNRSEPGVRIGYHLPGAEGLLSIVSVSLIRVFVVRNYSLRDLFSMAIESCEVVVGLEGVRCDNHDLSVEVIQILD